MRSLLGNLRLRPWCIDWVIARSIHQGRGLRLCNDWKDKVIYLLYYMAIIMDLSQWSIKTNNWSVGNFKKTCRLNEMYPWAHDTVRWQWSADTLFDSCQLAIIWMSIRMSTIKLNTDCIWLGHLASNARSLQE